MVSNVRTRLRAKVAAPAGPPGRHLASGRAVRQDPGAATVSVAGVDEDGDVLDILVQSRRNRRAATRFFRTLLKRQGREPRRLITDKLRSYSAAHRTVMPSVVHSTHQYENNRAEVSHQPTRQREQQMRGFTSAAHLHRFASVHGVVQNLFRVGRHLLRAAHHRLLRARSFRLWDRDNYRPCQPT